MVHYCEISEHQEQREKHKNFKRLQKQASHIQRIRNQNGMNFLLEGIIQWSTAFKNMRKSCFQCRILYPPKI